MPISVSQPQVVSANIGYFMPIDYDEFVDTADFQEALIGTGVVPQIQMGERIPLANLSFGNIPTVTYVVTDGSPIILVSVFNTQYWSAS